MCFELLHTRNQVYRIVERQDGMRRCFDVEMRYYHHLSATGDYTVRTRCIFQHTCTKEIGQHYEPRKSIAGAFLRCDRRFLSGQRTNIITQHYSLLSGRLDHHHPMKQKANIPKHPAPGAARGYVILQFEIFLCLLYKINVLYSIGEAESKNWLTNTPVARYPLLMFCIVAVIII